MAMTNRGNYKQDSWIMKTLDQLVPQDHLVRKLEACIDFTFIYEKVRPLYSDIGRPSIDPVVLFKLLFINIIFGYNSMRRTCDECRVNVAYRWFLGLSIDEPIPNYSTWSQNYIRRYSDSSIFEEIFQTILKQAMDYGYVDVESVFCDGTHQKASANKRKATTEEVDIVQKFYDEELLKEINEIREAEGKKPFQHLKKEETIFNEETGKEEVVKKKKTIKVSETDPESGCFHKGEKEKCFAYTHQTACDKNGFVLESVTVPGNIHDSVSFYPLYQKLMVADYGAEILNFVLDAGYKNVAICRELLLNGIQPYLPYKRPMTKKGYLKKTEYVYDCEEDCYICPNHQILRYTTTTREGYRQYKSDPSKCIDCPFLKQCTKSKNHEKLIQRHIWAEYMDKVETIRHTKAWKDIYPHRKETIERVFAECKENHGMRFTRLRGLMKNQHNSWLIFACHNLKKMALWKDKNGRNTKIISRITNIRDYFVKYTNNSQIKKTNRNIRSEYSIGYRVCQQSVATSCRFLFV